MNAASTASDRSTPPLRKRGLSGCAIGILIVGGTYLFAASVAAFFFVRAMSTPRARSLLSGAMSAATVYAQSGSAPGAKEVRALGCATAGVMDNTQIAAFASGDGGVNLANAPIEIFCEPQRDAAAPSCDEVAATYVAAMGGRASAHFQVDVGANGRSHGCRTRYGADGRRQ